MGKLSPPSKDFTLTDFGGILRCQQGRLIGTVYAESLKGFRSTAAVAIVIGLIGFFVPVIVNGS